MSDIQFQWTPASQSGTSIFSIDMLHYCSYVHSMYRSVSCMCVFFARGCVSNLGWPYVYRPLCGSLWPDLHLVLISIVRPVTSILSTLGFCFGAFVSREYGRTLQMSFTPAETRSQCDSVLLTDTVSYAFSDLIAFQLQCVYLHLVFTRFLLIQIRYPLTDYMLIAAVNGLCV